MNFKPLNNNILLKSLNSEKKIGNIVIPDTVNQSSNQAEVVAVSDKLHVSVAVGQKVLYKKGKGQPVKIGPESFLIVSEEDLLGVIND